MRKHILFILVFISAVWGKAQLTSTENYVSATTCLDADCVKKAWSVQYFDGLGRVKQVVNVKASPGQKDVVTHIEYDEYGRQVRDYLPVPQSASTGGAIYSDPLSNLAATPYGNERIYSEKILENSPLDRIQQQIQPGNDWQNRRVKFDYLANTGADVLKFTTTTGIQNNAFYISELKVSGHYPAGQLYKNKLTDEDGSVSYEFKNGEGQTLLVRKVLGNGNNNQTGNIAPGPGTLYADTYYIYDQYNHLVYVIPPSASSEFNSTPNQTIASPDADDTLNNLCYQYRYDGRSRLVEKKLPGKGWEHMVYDRADRLVLTQDANLRLAEKWLFTKYDKFGRVVYTGITSGDDRATMQDAISDQVVVEHRDRGFTQNGLTILYSKDHYPSLETVLSVNYYDSFPSGTPYPAQNEIFGEPVLTESYDSLSRSAKSLPLASFVKNIGEDKWTKTYTFYDTRARPVGTHSQNHFGGSTVVYSELDFSGVLVKAETWHKRINTEIPVHIVENFEYDHANRLEKHYHEVVGKTPQILLTESTYNEIGQLAAKKVGDNIEEIKYNYNIRGWMTGINLSNTSEIDNSRLFSYKIRYNTPLNTALKKYNGNIAEVDWAYQSESTQRYEYSYDELNRLQKANYKTIWQTTTTDSKLYNEQLTYDLNGNILTLKRNARPFLGGQPAVLADDLAYEYEGNRVTNITDASGNSSGYPGGGGSITYDDNGNMIAMPDKGISNIVYNHLNLPQQVDQNTYVTKYLYRADGVKLHKKFTISEQVIDTDYLDGFVYTIPYTDEIDAVLRENPDAALAGQADALELAQRVIGGGGAPPAQPTATPSFFPTAEGFYDYENYRYIYQYKDHLGNVRLSYVSNEGSAEALSSNDYYPFGLNFINLAPRFGGSVYNPVVTYEAYKYNGKELQETGMYDYGARFYMPDIGRFGTQDFLAEFQYPYSSYSYVYGNPIRFIDPTGMIGEDFAGGDDPKKKKGDPIKTTDIQEVVVYGKKKVSGVINWFTGANTGYTGSGWGHGPRRWVANQIGIGNTASNLFELGLQSQLQAKQVNLTGRLLNMIKNDPDMIKHQKNIIKTLQNDPRFKKVMFKISGKIGVEFGGKRWGSSNENWGALNSSNPILHKETWGVAGNDLTWSTRHASVGYTATVQGDGTISISYHLSDTLDLSAQPGRSEAYNNISSATGFLYHDVAGGNSEMQVNADWQTIVK